MPINPSLRRFLQSVNISEKKWNNSSRSKILDIPRVMLTSQKSPTNGVEVNHEETQKGWHKGKMIYLEQTY